MQRWFVCHSTRDDAEVVELVRSLQIHGIGVMVDHDRLFQVSQFTDEQACQILADSKQCCGLIFYATKDALSSAFIQTVEVPAALRRANIDPSFRIATIPRGIDHAYLGAESMRLWGEDLARRYTLPTVPAGPIGASTLRRVTLAILDDHAGMVAVGDLIHCNLCTRDYLEPQTDLAFDFDARWLFHDNLSDPRAWRRLRESLEDVKTTVRWYVARPKVMLSGSKHLSAGFMAGRVFSSPVVEELRVVQGKITWSTKQTPVNHALLEQVDEALNAVATEAALCLSATDHDPRLQAKRWMQRNGIECHGLTYLVLSGGPVRGGVPDAQAAKAIALEVRAALIKLVNSNPTTTVHLFLAVPQGLAVFIGHFTNGLPPLQLYEYVDGEYVQSALIT